MALQKRLDTSNEHVSFHFVFIFRQFSMFTSKQINQMDFNYLGAHLICLEGRKRKILINWSKSFAKTNDTKQKESEIKNLNDGFAMAEISSHIWLECKSSLIATKWDENCFRQNIIPSAKFFVAGKAKNGSSNRKSQ